MIDIERLWVQHETGQVMDGSTVDLADEPVTRLVDVIKEWQQKFTERTVLAANALTVEYESHNGLDAAVLRAHHGRAVVVLIGEPDQIYGVLDTVEKMVRGFAEDGGWKYA